MPNDCWNNITIKATNQQLRDILLREFQDIPAWAFSLKDVGCEAIVFSIWSKWAPNEDFMMKLFDTYANIWIKNDWHEEGGAAGIIVGTKDKLERLTWEEGCIEEWAHRLRRDETMPRPLLHIEST